MTKFRIIEEKIGNQDPSYCIQEKAWYGWCTHVEDIRDGSTICDCTRKFVSPKKAIEWLNKWYPTSTKVVKELSIG